MKPSVKSVPVFVLALFNHWVFSFTVFPQFDSLVGAGSNALPLAIFLGFAIVSQIRPSFVAHERFTQVALGFVIASAAALFANAQTGSPVIITAGTVLMAVGIFWMDIRATLALMPLNRIACAFVLATSLAISHPIIFLSGRLDFEAGLSCIALASFALFFASASAAPVLAKYRNIQSPYNLAGTNPFSFIPLNSSFFGLFFVISLVYGYISRGDASGAIDPLSVFTLAPLLVLSVCYLIQRTTLSADTLFKGGACFVIVALVIELAYPGQAHSLVRSVSLAGSELYDLVFYWYALSIVGSKNETAVLPMLTYGRSVLALGSFIGLLFRDISTQLSGYSAILSPIPLCVIAFLFLAYIVIMRNAFLFDDLAERIRPVGAIENLTDADCTKTALPRKELDDYLKEFYLLTAREIEVYELLRLGRDCNFVQKELLISRNTVRSHIRSIYTKLDIHSHQDLISFDQKLSRSFQDDTR